MLCHLPVRRMWKFYEHFDTLPLDIPTVILFNRSIKWYYVLSKFEISTNIDMIAVSTDTQDLKKLTMMKIHIKWNNNSRYCSSYVLWKNSRESIRHTKKLCYSMILFPFEPRHCNSKERRTALVRQSIFYLRTASRHVYHCLECC